MRKFVLNKLVRDKLLNMMQKLGQDVDYKILDDKEFLAALADKLREEVKEFDPNDPKAIEEIADILEVIDQLIKSIGITHEQVKEVQTARRKERGGITKRVFVNKLTLQDNDPWANYYASQPDRFTEIK